MGSAGGRALQGDGECWGSSASLLALAEHTGASSSSSSPVVHEEGTVLGQLRKSGL